jgi:hypothetical protein
MQDASARYPSFEGRANARPAWTAALTAPPKHGTPQAGRARAGSKRVNPPSLPGGGAGGSLLFKRTMRIKPPHRPLWCLRLGTRRWKAVHARPRCGG